MGIALALLLCARPAPAGTAAPKPAAPWKLVVPASPQDGEAARDLRLSPREALVVGRRLWRNEAGGTIRGLTDWNPGEDFASLGIGHFIWYPLGMEGPFVESFPPMLAYLQARGVAVPDWLEGGVPCPWDSREEFYSQIQSPKMRALRSLLRRTVGLQAEFAAARLERAVPAMLASLPPPRRAAVLAQFRRLARTRGGAYPLVDYVNFKGEGISPAERYQGQGWGLLQVLEGMRGSAPGRAALAEFSRSAAAVLRRRARLSPRPYFERRWLAVWLRRVRSYRAPPYPSSRRRTIASVTRPPPGSASRSSGKGVISQNTTPSGSPADPSNARR